MLGGLLYPTLWAAVAVVVAKSSQVAPHDLRQSEVFLSFCSLTFDLICM